MEHEATESVDNFSVLALATEVTHCTQSCTDGDVRCCSSNSFTDFTFSE
jgi:hypothetical protein